MQHANFTTYRAGIEGLTTVETTSDDAETSKQSLGDAGAVDVYRDPGHLLDVLKASA